MEGPKPGPVTGTFYRRVYHRYLEPKDLINAPTSTGPARSSMFLKRSFNGRQPASTPTLMQDDPFLSAVRSMGGALGSFVEKRESYPCPQVVIGVNGKNWRINTPRGQVDADWRPHTVSPHFSQWLMKEFMEMTRMWPLAGVLARVF